MPEVAKSWEWSADGKQLTMHLIEGAKWSDGVPFNADDVMFTWEGYILDPNVNCTRQNRMPGPGTARPPRLKKWTITRSNSPSRSPSPWMPSI